MQMMNVALGNCSTKMSNIDDEMIQSNAVDVRVDKIFEIGNDIYELTADNKKRYRTSVEMQTDSEGFWTLQPGKMYEYVSTSGIEVGPDEAGWIIGRSSNLRSGVLISSCLYDSGYKGAQMGTITVFNGPARIQRGARIGQYICVKAECAHLYSGSYGYGKQYDQKYGVTAESQNLK